MNCRSAGSKSLTGISFDLEPGWAGGGVVFPSCAARVVIREQRTAKQTKLMRDNVNSPLSLNELKPGSHGVQYPGC